MTYHHADAVALLTLHELTAELMVAIHRSEGQIDDEVKALMESYAGRHGERSDRVGLLRSLELRLKAEATQLQAEVDRLQARAKRLQKLANSARARATRHMEDHALLSGELSLEVAGQRTCRLVPNPGRVVGPDDPRDWPASFQRHHVTVDRAAARAALAAGEDHEGLRIEQTGHHLRWS